MTLVWGRPLVDGGAIVTAELADLAVDQCALAEGRFTLLAPDDYRGDTLDVKVFDARGRELARESLYATRTTRRRVGVELEEAIRTRRTHKAYGAEPVDRADAGRAVRAARWAPNHHLTNPWRFRVLGPARARAPEGGRRRAGPRLGRQARPRPDARRRLGRAMRR